MNLFKKITVLTLAITMFFNMLAVNASSHREAPFITEVPKLDGTDVYMFRSSETGREDFVTIIANYHPLQDQYGGPTYFTLAQNGVYEIQIDNNHDAQEDITFRFTPNSKLRGLSVPAGDKNTAVPLNQIGQIGPQVDNPNALNFIEDVDFEIVRGESLKTKGKAKGKLTGGTFVTTVRKPFDNAGTKSIPDYATYALNHVKTFTFPGCDDPNASDSKVFVGQRQEAFFLNLGEIFDLVNVADPVADQAGDSSKETNTIGNKGITTFAIEVPRNCLAKESNSATNPIIAGWTRSLTPSLVNQLNEKRIPAFNIAGNLIKKLGIASDDLSRAQRPVGDRYVQVSRLGMPLVNELVIGYTHKDIFNASEPQNDAQFLDFVTNPSFPVLLQVLFPSVVTAPSTPRNDLVATFLTGNAGLNKPSEAGAKAYEAMRLNMSIDITPPAQRNPLGFAGGDLDGYPNGRRPEDDVVDITLRVANGLLLTLDPNTAAQAPTGTVPLTDGAAITSGPVPVQLLTRFPYLGHPVSPSPAN